MIRRPPRSTRTDTRCPSTTLVRSREDGGVRPRRQARHRANLDRPRHEPAVELDRASRRVLERTLRPLRPPGRADPQSRFPHATHPKAGPRRTAAASAGRTSQKSGGRLRRKARREGRRERYRKTPTVRGWTVAGTEQNQRRKHTKN